MPRTYPFWFNFFPPPPFPSPFFHLLFSCSSLLLSYPLFALLSSLSLPPPLSLTPPLSFLPSSLPPSFPLSLPPSFPLPSLSPSLFPSLPPSLPRHEMPTDPNDPLSHQNLKDRYYGVNNPVADKLLNQASAMPMLSAPDDKSITSLYVGGMDASITENDIRSVNPEGASCQHASALLFCCMHIASFPGLLRRQLLISYVKVKGDSLVNLTT